MPQLAIALLGPLQVTLDGAPVTTFESDKVRALLAYLAVESDRPHRRQSLAALLWPERPDRAAQLNLNQALSNLRRAIGDRDAAAPHLSATRDSVGLRVGADCAVDVVSFSALLDAVDAHQHRDAAGCAACAERLERAAALYRGEFLAQLAPRDCQPFQEWALVARERLHRRACGALAQLAASHERRGDLEAALGAASRLAELDPLAEEAHRLIMRLLWQGGQRAAALAQYERCRAVLDAELGVEPEEETEALAEQIRAAPAAPAAPAAAELPGLPQPPTPFVGREAELARLLEYLGDPGCRLVTIVGLGGSGKTRLALRGAEAARHAFAGGALFVPLAAASAADQVAPAVAQRAGVQLGGREDGAAQLGAALRGRRVLLVLDNLEQIPGAAEPVAALLAHAPDLTVLATSRERLGLQAEWALDLGGLAVPADASEAGVRSAAAGALFLQAARRARAGFAPSPAERAAVAAICRRLGGHALAIELAAAWVRVLSCAEIEAELRTSMELLSSSAGDLPERHRTLRAVFDATWRLLSPEERRALERLSVMAGGFDRQAAEAAGAGLAELAALCDRSLVEREPGGRFALHELVRQYAAERLQQEGEQAGAELRHRAHYFGLVERAEPHMKGPDEAAWMDRLEADHDNLRAALEGALASGALEEAARACEVLRWFWYIRGHYGDGLRWTERVLAALQRRPAAAPAARRGKLLQGAGIFADEQGDYTLAAARYAQALAVYRAQGDTRGIQATTNSLGMLEWAQGRYASAQACFAECLRLCRQLGHPWGVANSLNSYGTALQAQGDAPGALAAFEEALGVARDVGHDPLVTLVLDNIGDVTLALGDVRRARAAFLEALAMQRAGADLRGAALSLQGLGRCALAQGDLAEAERQLHEGLRLSWRSANRRDLTTYVDNLAALRAAQGRHERAAALSAAATAARSRIGAPLTAHERAAYERTVGQARDALGAAFDAAWAAGAASPLEDVIQAELGDVAGG